jgi:hypothetical protein
LHELGFTKCKTEYGLYTHVKNKLRLVVGVWVDDLIIMGESDQERIVLKEEMKSVFRMSDLGDLSYYLDIEVRHGNRALGLANVPMQVNCLRRQV